MKTRTKIAACLLAMLFIVMTFASCIKTDRARATVSDFLKAVETEDYEGAMTLWHPDYAANMSGYIAELEQRYDADFSAGVTVRKYTGFKSSAYDTNVGGSFYSTSFIADVGGREATIYVELIENDNGYGINYIRIGFGSEEV